LAKKEINIYQLVLTEEGVDMWLNKLERKFGKYAIKNLSLYLVIGYAIGYILTKLNPEIDLLIGFNPEQIASGQIWRLFTWIILLPENNMLFLLIMLVFYYSIGSQLEMIWGTFRYNVYMFSGIICTLISSLISFYIAAYYYECGLELAGILTSIGTTPYYLNMTLFLAFALCFPDAQINMYFILPIKAKYLSAFYILLMLLEIVDGGLYTAALTIASLLNFIIFYLSTKNIRGRYNSSKRKHDYMKKVKAGKANSTYANGARHKCAVCGRTEIDNPELTFRYCSKCSGGKEYCQDHLFTHEHK